MVCGTCDQCRAGRTNTCRNLQFMGCPGEALGAVAEYRVVPAENCFPIPDRMTLDEAALVEPLSVGLHAVRLGRRLRPAARIAILGAGPIGLSVLLCAKAAGSCTVYVTDLLDERLEVARHAAPIGPATPSTARPSAAILQQAAAGLGPGVRVFRRSAVRRSRPEAARARRHAGAGGHSADGSRDLRHPPHAAQGIDVQERPPPARLRRRR